MCVNGSLGFVQTSPKIQINSKFFFKVLANTNWTFYAASRDFITYHIFLAAIIDHIHDFVMRINTCALETKFLQGPNKHSFDNVTQNLRQSQKSRPSLELYPIQFFSIDNWLLSKKCPPTVTCLKSTIQKLEKSLIYVQSLQ